MEVNKIGKTTPTSKKNTNDIPADKISFAEIMVQQREQRSIDKFVKMAEKIEDQGKILAESRTVEDLKKYKELVKQFMDEVIKKGLQLEERRGFNRRGRAKIYKLITKVDEKLLELTDHVLKKQANSLKILGLVGEIKGLLVDMYT
ncbi:conserved hypothetical protein [Heliomicrobium modesticaldum Ice1]|uniref:DUF327 domain-containing protein n=1 Tax=Heliobacterium modesticaldum (strain ATCC 51547 / Ice1) TaxID=498761 RepID=B0TGZ8_HELMI|nr:YaaR family protein [Heliomicrobium modesticaldum]ABZ83323.1 conserved hypothetical protein [Heliomicrobium modesticaldum Ice1]